MLNRATTYLFDVKKKITGLLPINKFRLSPEGLCCISVSIQEIIFIYIKKESGKMVIKYSESHSYTDKNSLISLLNSIVKNNSFKNITCTLMLHPDDYQLIVTDQLPVTPSEFQSAIRWKIKDQLRFSLDDVVIDSFVLPKMKNNINKIMVVAAQASKLKTLCEQIRHCGLNLKSVDIPELALRNISFLYGKNEKTFVFIYVQDNSTLIQITSQKELYVTRTLKLKFNMSNPQGIERLADEVQRSFDYYQSLWDQPLPSSIIVASTGLINPEVTNFLSQKIKIPVEIIDLSKDFVIPKNMIDKQGKYLLVLGGALRQQSEYTQVINLYDAIPKPSGWDLTLRQVIFSYSLFTLLLLTFTFVILWQKHKLTAQFDHLNVEASHNQQQLNLLLQEYPINDLNELKKTIGLLQKEYEDKKMVIDLLSHNANFSSYLLALGYAIVPGVWLTQISFDRGEDKILLRGYALEAALLEQFYSRLQNQPSFSSLKFEINEIKQTSYPASFYITAKKRILHE